MKLKSLLTLALTLAIGSSFAFAAEEDTPLAKEMKTVNKNIRTLKRQVEDASQRLSAVWGLWNFSLIVADLRTARELSEEIADLAGRMSGQRALLDAHRRDEGRAGGGAAVQDLARHRRLRGQPGQPRADPGLVRRLCAAGLRDRGEQTGAGAR